MRRPAAVLATALLGVVVGPALAGDGTFTPAPGPPQAVGDAPASVAVGDLNGDGNQDLVAANNRADTVSVLLGNGEGAFTIPGAAPAVGDGPFSIAVGDLDNDGNQDVVTVNHNAPRTVSVLLGNGAGGFAAPGPATTVGDLPLSVAVGDLDNDGNHDVVTANTGDDTVSVLLGNGAGGVAAAPGPAPAVGDEPRGVAVGDLNNDGNPDLVTANAGADTVSVLLGNGVGGFAAAPGPAPTVGDLPRSVAVGDLNGDGNQDLVTANVTADTVSVLLGNGAGAFAAAPGAAPAVGDQPLLVAVGDLDNDGNPDLATANAGADSTSVLVGNGAGGFSAAPGAAHPAGESPLSVAVGDLNNDGNQDLAFANFDADTVSVLLGNGPSPRLGNLLVNPGAEGAGAAGNASATPVFGGWTRTFGGATFLRYASTGGFPSLIDAARWGGGTNFFTGGIGEFASAEQVVGVADRAVSIDAGRASATLSGLVGGYNRGADDASVSAGFLGAGGQALGASLVIGPVTTAERRNQTVLLRRAVSGAIPPGTRSIRVTMTFIRRPTGSYNDGYLDDLALRVSSPSPTPGTPGIAPSRLRCAGKRATIVARGRVTRGTRRADVIVGRGGPDVIHGRGGADVVCGRGGADRLIGGAGRDRLLGGPGADRLLGGPGRDVLLGGAGRDRLVGGGGLDRLLGGPGRDRQAQ